MFVKNIKQEDWEAKLWYVVLGLSIALVALGCLFNIFHVGYYPPTDWRPCCPAPDYFTYYYNSTGRT